MQFTLEYLVLASIVGLTLVLTLILLFWLTRVARHYNSLTKGIDQKTLTNALEGIQKSLSELARAQGINKSEIQKIKEENKLHLKHLSLNRFNPFSDTGGDQSFILAILNTHKDGVLITSLHTRENTRFYVKSISGGAGIDHPLSQEEQKIINRLGK